MLPPRVNRWLATIRDMAPLLTFLSVVAVIIYYFATSPNKPIPPTAPKVEVQQVEQQQEQARVLQVQHVSFTPLPTSFALVSRDQFDNTWLQKFKDTSTGKTYIVVYWNASICMTECPSDSR